MLLHTWLPAVLRAAGIKVIDTAGWTGRSHGALPAKIKVIWHHDASPVGPSPGALSWMISNWSSSSAQVWVDMAGAWHLVGTGVAWHAGKVLAGMPGNFDSIGIETDHTTGENWPPAQLDSLRRGTAAIFRHQAVSSDWLHFHKSVCDPPGRKVDPDGLTLSSERATVAKMIGSAGSGGGSTTPPPTQGDWFDMATKDDLKAAVREVLREAGLVSYQATDQGSGATSQRSVSVVQGIGDGTTYAGRAARAATLAQK
jgi:hypothetical protein